LTPMCTSSVRWAVMRSMTMLRVSIVDRCGGVERSRSGAILGRSGLLVYRSHALRGNAVLEALRPVLWWVATRSVWGFVTQAERGNDETSKRCRGFNPLHLSIQPDSASI
jgi:hypothetical protein